MLSDFTDEELMVRVAAGDMDALAVIYSRYHKQLVSYAVTITRSGEAEDIVQDVLVNLLIYRHTYRPGNPVKPWLLTICRRKCTDYRRAAKRYARFGQPMPNAAGLFGEGTPMADAQPGREDEPDAALLREELRERLLRAFPCLTELQRRCVVGRHLEGKSYDELIAELGCPEGSVRSSIHYGLHNLANKLGVFDDTEGRGPRGPHINRERGRRRKTRSGRICDAVGGGGPDQSDQDRPLPGAVLGNGPAEFAGGGGEEAIGTGTGNF